MRRIRVEVMVEDAEKVLAAVRVLPDGLFFSSDNKNIPEENLVARLEMGNITTITSRSRTDRAVNLKPPQDAHEIVYLSEEGCLSFRYQNHKYKLYPDRRIF